MPQFPQKQAFVLENYVYKDGGDSVVYLSSGIDYAESDDSADIASDGLD